MPFANSKQVALLQNPGDGLYVLAAEAPQNSLLLPNVRAK